MKRLLIFGVLAFAGIMASVAQSRDIDVVLIGGQSNATGQGAMANLKPDMKIDHSVLIYYSAMLNGGEGARKLHGLNQASEDPSKFGVELSMGTALKKGLGRDVAIIKHALSGSNLYDQWNPGKDQKDTASFGPEYRLFMQTVAEGMQALKNEGYNPTIRAMVWQQGEADARDIAGIDNSLRYAANLKHFISRVREDIDVPRLSFVYGYVIPIAAQRFTGRDIIRKAQFDISEGSGSGLSVPGAFIVETDDLTMKDDVHFDTDGIWKLGSRFADVILGDVFRITHGPYLLGRTTDGITAAFEMNRKSLSWIEVTEDGGGDIRRVYDSRHGLRQANNTRNGIRIEGLEAGKNYKYRVCSKEITKFNPYDVRFGDSIASPWYNFSMPKADKSEGSYLFISDMHSLPMKFDTLLRLGGLDVNSVFMGGDMVNDAMGPEDPYIILDKATELFATHIPMSFVRGNHETRGVYSRFVADFFPTPSGKFYTTFSDGEILFVMLDCGEDKADDTPVYAGCADFDAYRSEQAEWLKQLVETPEFKNAKYRIVATHIPPRPDGWHGDQDAYNKWMPILNNAGIDLMLCGHTHRFGLIERQTGKYEFPVVIGSNKSVTRIDVRDNNIIINVIQKDGVKLIDNMVIKK